MVIQFVNVGILPDPSQIDELCERLLRNAIYVHAFLRHKAREFAKLFGWAVGVSAVQGLGLADLTHFHPCLVVTHGAAVGYLKLAYLLLYANHLGNNLVGFDD